MNSLFVTYLNEPDAIGVFYSPNQLGSSKIEKIEALFNALHAPLNVFGESNWCQGIFSSTQIFKFLFFLQLDYFFSSAFIYLLFDQLIYLFIVYVYILIFIYICNINLDV